MHLILFKYQTFPVIHITLISIVTKPPRDGTMDKGYHNLMGKSILGVLHSFLLFVASR